MGPTVYYDGRSARRSFDNHRINKSIRSNCSKDDTSSSQVEARSSTSDSTSSSSSYVSTDYSRSSGSTSSKSYAASTSSSSTSSSAWSSGCSSSSTSSGGRSSDSSTLHSNIDPNLTDGRYSSNLVHPRNHKRSNGRSVEQQQQKSVSRYSHQESVSNTRTTTTTPQFGALSTIVSKSSDHSSRSDSLCCSSTASDDGTELHCNHLSDDESVPTTTNNIISSNHSTRKKSNGNGQHTDSDTDNDEDEDSLTYSDSICSSPNFQKIHPISVASSTSSSANVGNYRTYRHYRHALLTSNDAVSSSWSSSHCDDTIDESTTTCNSSMIKSETTKTSTTSTSSQNNKTSTTSKSSMAHSKLIPSNCSNSVCTTNSTTASSTFNYLNFVEQSLSNTLSGIQVNENDREYSADDDSNSDCDNSIEQNNDDDGKSLRNRDVIDLVDCDSTCSLSRIKIENGATTTMTKQQLIRKHQPKSDNVENKSLCKGALIKNLSNVSDYEQYDAENLINEFYERRGGHKDRCKDNANKLYYNDEGDIKSFSTKEQYLVGVDYNTDGIMEVENSSKYRRQRQQNQHCFDDDSDNASNNSHLDELSSVNPIGRKEAHSAFHKSKKNLNNNKRKKSKRCNMRRLGLDEPPLSDVEEEDDEDNFDIDSDIERIGTKRNNNKKATLNSSTNDNRLFHSLHKLWIILSTFNISSSDNKELPTKHRVSTPTAHKMENDNANNSVVSSSSTSVVVANGFFNRQKQKTASELLSSKQNHSMMMMMVPSWMKRNDGVKLQQLTTTNNTRQQQQQQQQPKNYQPSSIDQIIDDDENNSNLMNKLEIFFIALIAASAVTLGTLLLVLFKSQ